MAINILGTTAARTAEVGSLFKGVAVTPKPHDVVGSYMVAARSLEIAAGSGSAAEVWAFRNPSTTKVCAIKRIHIQANTIATGFTAGVAIFDLKVARAFTVSPTAGTTVVLSGNNCKLRTDHATCVAVIDVADASVLTSGTEVADTTPIATIVETFPTTVQIKLMDRTMLEIKEGGCYPVVLEQDEGLILYSTVPATGTWFLTVTCEWDELLAADFAG